MPEPGLPRRLVLVVEDNPADQHAVREALREAGDSLELEVAEDGVEAMARLRSRRPALVILDLSLPRRHGLEVLSEIRGDPGLRSIPVAVMTSSPTEVTSIEGSTSSPDLMVRKPSNYGEYLRTVRSIVARFAGGPSEPRARPPLPSDGPDRGTP